MYATGGFTHGDRDELFPQYNFTGISMFDSLIHADWSTSAAKKWMAVATRSVRGWEVEAPTTSTLCPGIFWTVGFLMADRVFARIRFPHRSSLEIRKEYRLWKFRRGAGSFWRGGVGKILCCCREASGHINTKTLLSCEFAGAT